MSPLLRRAEITQATLDRFKDMPFGWGRGDCVQMAAFHLKAMGHRVLLSKGGRYRSALGAARALERAGYATLADALDGLGLQRIAPAAAWTGDIISLPQDDDVPTPFEALTIAVGNGRVIGWHPTLEGAAVMQPTAYLTAWRA